MFHVWAHKALYWSTKKTVYSTNKKYIIPFNTFSLFEQSIIN